MACQASLLWVFSKQEYWSILANTGCHTLLELYVSCLPSCQLPWVPGAAKTPATQAVAPPGAKPSPLGQPQKQSPGDNPHAEVEIKPQLKPRAVWLKKKTQNLPTSCKSSRLNPHDQLGRLCVYGIYKRTLKAPTKENALVLLAVDIGGKNTQEWDQIRIWTAPTAGPEISTMLEGILGRWGGLWRSVRERTLTAVSQEKHLLFLCFDLFCRFFWIFFFSPTPL